MDIKQRSVTRSLFKYNPTVGKCFYPSGGQRNTLAQVSMYDSVRRSLLKYNSTLVKRFHSSGGQRNILAQISMYDSVRRSLFKYNSAAVNAFSLLVDKGICWLKYR